ncbi:MAG: acyl--CoA ligase [Oscillospiraceae bacterium]|nr:acyl--CoA ligase [Oscillospiraceae bacterium]
MITGAELGCYSLSGGERPFGRANRNADDFMFGRHHGKDREDYAINFVGVRTTYNELDAQVERVARALFGYGIRQGDYVTFAMPNLPETIVYIYACWRIGAIVNLADPRTNPEGILERARMTRSKLLITLDLLAADKIDPILDKLPCEHVILVSVTDSLKGNFKPKPLLGYFVLGDRSKKFTKSHPAQMQPRGKYYWHKHFVADHPFKEDIRAINDPGMVAAVVYTSGTSADGLMKGAVLTHDALNSAATGLYFTVEPQDRRRRDTFGGFIPFFSAYGIMNGMHVTLCGGLEILLVPKFDPNKFAEMILKLRPNTFLGVPRFYEQLANHPKLKGKSKRLAFIRNPVSGGDKISLASIERINDCFARNGSTAGLRVGYGSTELGGSIAVMPSYDPATSDFPWRAQGCVGYIMPQCTALVIDPETGEQLPFGVDGELCVSSRNMMEEYFELPEQTKEITYIAPDGTKFYRLGDMGHLDANGVFYFIDRYKRSTMRPDGHTVHPSPIENVIMNHESVQVAAVVGVPLGVDTAGAIPSAFVVLREEYRGKTPEEERALLLDIDKLCLKCLPERDRAIAYRAVDEIPYTPMGKVDFRALEKEIFEPKNFLLTDFAFFPEWAGR